MTDNKFNFDQFLNKRVKILQRDNFIKDGILKGWDEDFIFLEFKDSQVAISKDMIIEVKVLEES